MSMSIERDITGRLVPPTFRSNVPPYLLEHLKPAEKWQCEQQSIARQQNDWLINVTLDVDTRLLVSEKELGKLRKLRWLLSGKWSLVTAVATSLLIPGALTVFLVWLERRYNH